MAETIDGYSLDEARAELARWKAAVAGLASSQSYTIGTRTLTRVDLAEAREMIAYYAGIIAALDPAATDIGGGVRAFRVMPRDL